MEDTKDEKQGREGKLDLETKIDIAEFEHDRMIEVATSGKKFTPEEARELLIHLGSHYHDVQVIIIELYENRIKAGEKKRDFQEDITVHKQDLKRLGTALFSAQQKGDYRKLKDYVLEAIDVVIDQPPTSLGQYDVMFQNAKRFINIVPDRDKPLRRLPAPSWLNPNIVEQFRASQRDIL